MSSVSRILRYRFAVRLDDDEAGTFHGWAPALRGVHTFGDTEDETLANLQEAVQLHVESLVRDGLTAPDDPAAATAAHVVEVVVPWAMFSRG